MPERLAGARGSQPAPTPTRSASAPDSVLRDEQTLLAGVVERLRDTTGMELATAWALRGAGEPYMVAAAFEGEPPATPDLHAWQTATGWERATEVSAPSALVKAFPGRRAIAAVAVRRSDIEPLAVICLASSSRERVRPRTLATLDSAARRLATPLAAARAARRLTGMEERLRQLDRLASLGKVAAEVAHEVRNPLVSVKTFLQLLPERRDDPEFATDFLAVATEELARVERLLAALIAYPRRQVDEDGADVAQALEHVTELLRHFAQAHRVEILSAPREDLPAAALDTDALRQVLLNLTLNAIEVSPEGGRVTLSASRAQEGLEIRVDDAGPGVPEGHREQVFEPFHSTRGEGHGGLGLSISRRIAEEAGGTLRVEDPPGGGACFRVELPSA